VTGGDVAIEGGKRKSRSRTRWIKLVASVYNGGKGGMSYKSAMRKAKSLYRRSA
jgi:hypothetical protein